MLMLLQMEKLSDAPAGWMNNGHIFVVHDPDTFTRVWLPAFFQGGKLSSFIRKLYRWGFKQVRMKKKGDGKKDKTLYFYNKNFQRNNKALLKRMRSVSSPGARVVKDVQELGITPSPDRSVDELDQMVSPHLVWMVCMNLTSSTLLTVNTRSAWRGPERCQLQHRLRPERIEHSGIPLTARDVAQGRRRPSRARSSDDRDARDVISDKRL